MAYRLHQQLLTLLFFSSFVLHIPIQGKPPTLHLANSIGNRKLSAAQPPIVDGDGGDLLPSLPHARYYPPAGGGSSLAAPPSTSPSSDGGGIALISSNPAISLPAGESDSAAARCLPDSGKGNSVNGRGIGFKVATWAALVVALTFWSL